jgi:hypothetical protein
MALAMAGGRARLVDAHESGPSGLGSVREKHEEGEGEMASSPRKKNRGEGVSRMTGDVEGQKGSSGGSLSRCGCSSASSGEWNCSGGRWLRGPTPFYRGQARGKALPRREERVWAAVPP